jgi:hypothetical protein
MTICSIFTTIKTTCTGYLIFIEHEKENIGY